MAKKRLSEEDLLLWKRIAANVEPLKHPARLAPKRPHVPSVATKPEPKSAKAKAAAAPPKKATAAPRPSPPVSVKTSPASPTLDRRTATKLRRGQIAVEAKLDLHGLTQGEAHGALRRFVLQSREAGRRCVLVVTGMGTISSDGSSGILRRSVPRWLAEASMHDAVLSFAPAEPRHGGHGALYVLLRRKR